MKIEIGESLLYSWLRHVKECQIVQTNWKPSSQWKLKNTDKLLEIMGNTHQYFENEYGYSIYKKNSLEQLLMQAEIDVLGVAMDDGGNHIYAVDVAFHEAGLNYGSKDETVTRIIKKCLRTAMCIYGHMDTDEGEIIFASPKINTAVLDELRPKMDEINTLLEQLGLRFKTRLIANEEFNVKILKPIILASGGISDTSELFLRSYQMYNMFSRDVNTIKKQGTTRDTSNTVIDSNLSDETLKELKIGKLVQITMKYLFEEEKIKQDEIDKMTEKGYSKQIFKANLPVLRKVPTGSNINALKKDANN